ncbi:MAG: TerB family tellurite resistance protein [Methylococcales bacterium]|nr:TerB family tellurite resistance protein [Methylococcales bacterium]
MSSKNSSEWFNDTESVISEPLKFKVKLAIGEDAYTSLRVKDAVFEAWDTLGVATTAITIAKSSAVASTFFAPTGFLAAIGIGTAATPLGWVIAAGVVSSSAWVGITRYIKKQSNSRVTVIPKFINTPMDVLAVGLFDLIVPLALKIAIVDGKINKSEKTFISHYFIKEWGYDPAFVKDGIAFTESNLSNFSIQEIACSLAEFQKTNPDCNYREMTKEMLTFLKGITESDGKIDAREEMIIEKIECIFAEANKINIKKNIVTGWNKCTNLIGNIIRKGIKHSRH